MCNMIRQSSNGKAVGTGLCMLKNQRKNLKKEGKENGY